MKKFWKTFTNEQRKLRCKHLGENRLKAEYKPNGIEEIMIAVLQELGIYAKDAKSAKLGQVYYADAKGNKWYRRTPDGRLFIPDFKVKGLNTVFEIYGDYWHSRQRCEPLGLPEDTWNSEKKQAIY